MLSGGYSVILQGIHSLTVDITRRCSNRHDLFQGLRFIVGYMASCTYIVIIYLGLKEFPI